MSIYFGALVVLLLLTQKLRKYCKLHGLKQLERLYLFIMIASVVLFVVDSSVKIGVYTHWIWLLLVIGTILHALSQQSLSVLRMFIYAFVPFAAVAVITYSVQQITPSFYDEWNDVFDYAKGFAFIWMGIAIFMQNRQLKSAEKDRLKRLQEDEHNRAIAIRKVELEGLVTERTAELTKQKDELEHALTELQSTQKQLIQSEKMASLGELTAGIAHEIQNPLNFINNFSEINAELIEELKTEKLKPQDQRDLESEELLLNDITQNLEKINHHGKRADSIVKGMLQHSRSSNGVKEPTNINTLADEYFRLAYHGLRAKDKSFNATMLTDYDAAMVDIKIIPQDIGRVILNLITNAFYTVTEKKKMMVAEGNTGYEPTVTVSSKYMGDKVLVSVKDNGNGISAENMEKIFQPFFTTKPTGQGTGLGLSMSYDIIKAHNGELKATTELNGGTTFMIYLPI